MLHGRVRVYGDTAVTLSSDRNGQRNEFASLRVKFSALVTRVAGTPDNRELCPG